MPVGGETSQVSHTLKNQIKDSTSTVGDQVTTVTAVGRETSQLSHAQTLKKKQKNFLNEKK